ncbi:hypothetical protein [Deinococcus kurensis]|uniref:hypothetical protein n=1 Tax=Deinococcus kurensis TaxID=2662757 RepID=UPI0012D2DB7E|nr:hypothetical protein [Deinococcus kurensis]
MFIITRQQVTVAVLALALMAAVILLDLTYGFGVGVLAVSVMSGLIVSLQIWEEHRVRQNLASCHTENLEDGRMVFRLTEAGLQPVTLHGIERRDGNE